MFSSVYLTQGVCLGLVRRRVEVQSRFPLDLLHMAGRVHGKGDVQPIELRVSKLPSVYVPCQQNGAVTASRRAQEYAWARDFTVACLEVISIQFPLRQRLLSLTD